MTPAEQVTLREHIDSRFDGVEREIRGVHRRINEVQDDNRRDHDEVKEALAAVAVRVDRLEGKEDRRDERQRLGSAVLKVALGIVTGLLVAVVGAYAAGLLNP